MPSSKFAYYKAGTSDKQIFVVTVGLNIKSDYATLVAFIVCLAFNLSSLSVCTVLCFSFSLKYTEKRLFLGGVWIKPSSIQKETKKN